MKALSPTTGLVFACLLCDYLLTTAAIPIFPVLHASDFYTGLLFGSKAVVQVLATPFVTRFLDHRLGMIRFALLVDVASTLVFAFTSTYWPWLVARGVQGLASAALISAAFAQLQHVYQGHDHARGRAMSLATSGIITGVSLGPPLGGLLFDLAPSAPFLGLSVFVLLTLGLTFCVPSPASDAARRCSGDEGHAGSSISTLLADPAVLVVLGSLLVANAAIAALEATIGQFLAHRFHMSAPVIGLVYTINAVPSVLATLLAGWLGGCCQRWKVLLVGLVLQGGFFALGPKNDLWIMYLSLVGIGVGMGLVDGVCPAMLADQADRFHGRSSAVYALSTAAIQIGFIVGPLAGSSVMQKYGFGEMGLVLGAAMVLVAPLVCAYRQRLEGQRAATAFEPVPSYGSTEEVSA